MANFSDYQLRVLEKEHIDCIDVVELLGDYHDGELPESLRGRLHAHIEACPHCQALRDGYDLTIKLAKQLKEERMPSGVQNRLREALNRRLGINLALSE